MSEELDRIRALVKYAASLSGDEKGEAQVFCDRLFKAFGHHGYKEAGATLEYRVKQKGGSTHFADLLWRPRLLIEMKKSGENLKKHYRQAFEYWIQLVPDRPRYVVLCNFDEFWIYNFNEQLDEPVDRVLIHELPERYTALNFLFPDDRRPQFGNDRVAVTRDAANAVAAVFNSLVQRGEDRQQAQRFILQCVVGMFSEDFDLLPKGLFTGLLDECANGQSSIALLGALFRQMNSRTKPRTGRFQNVDFFNGGLFNQIDPLELTKDESRILYKAAADNNWSKVAPPIFGTLFQSSMDKPSRHALGAHFTTEADIQKIVLPTIVRPWRERISKASTFSELRSLIKELLTFRILDPACGSGNFLYMAYRELVNIEMELLTKIHENFGRRAREIVGTKSHVSTKQFFGIDKDGFAVELAKVTLMLGKRVALADTQNTLIAEQKEIPYEFEEPLPLDNLDQNIRVDDALFGKWPTSDVIIGNPPYQSKNKMQEEFGRAYLNRLRQQFPDISGMADYCVYWFRRAHDELKSDGRAGLVGTNTIRQNFAREGGLDYIVSNGGTITEAVSSQVWSGDADVHVSIVNWIKGKDASKKRLFRQIGDQTDSPWDVHDLKYIGASLSGSVDVTKALKISKNIASDTCDQGQTHGHEGFLLTPAEAEAFLTASPRNREVIFPYLTINDMLSSTPPQPRRFVIDFHPRTILEAQKYTGPFKRVTETVLGPRQEKAKKEETRNEEALDEDPGARVNKHHENFLNRWWLFSWPRPNLIKKIACLSRYIVCGQVTKRPVFEFIHPEIRPNAALVVFNFEDDYSFGILQSGVHWNWFIERCSTLTERFRYTLTTVYDTFPWPQSPTLAQVKQVGRAAKALRDLRCALMKGGDYTLRELYRTLELPGQNPLKQAQEKLDVAVRAAYGMNPKANPLEFIFELNRNVADREAAMKKVVGPGLPPCVTKRSELITGDSVRA